MDTRNVLAGKSRAELKINRAVANNNDAPDGVTANCDQLYDWLRFIRDARWSRAQKHKLLQHFASPTQIYRSNEADLRNCTSGKWRSIDERNCDARLQLDLNWFDSPDKFLIPISDPCYPSLLREIDDPPLVLFAQGRLELLADPKVAMVGSRRPTPAGSKLCHQLASELARLGIVITSGLALGIDGESHQAALDSAGATIAVLGSGLDIVYPMRNSALHQRISEQGLLVSEFPLGLSPNKATFPQRNRIVSGLSLGAIIIEAAARSGTLITARLAMEQNREVMVVPGSALSRQYQGSHNLIKQGAALITGAEDVLNTLALPLQSIAVADASDPSRPQLGLSANALIEHVNYESTSLDSIILASGLTAAEVSSMLLMLELEGFVVPVDDGGYVRIA